MINTFIAKQMNAYISGGMRPETAARFTRGELEAIYKGNHYSRDASGAMRLTPPPEALGIDVAMRKADAALSEIMKGSRTGQAPENAPRTARKTGLEGLKNYARGNTA